MTGERGKEGEREKETIVLAALCIKRLYKSNHKRAPKIICFAVNMTSESPDLVFSLCSLRRDLG